MTTSNKPNTTDTNKWGSNPGQKQPGQPGQPAKDRSTTQSDWQKGPAKGNDKGWNVSADSNWDATKSGKTKNK